MDREFLHALAVIIILGVVYGIMDLLVRNLDGYVYIRAVMILVWILAAVLDYMLDWTGMTRLVFESYIAGLAAVFFLPVYLFPGFYFMRLIP